MNSPYQMEQFNTNIVYFGALNQCQRHVFLSITGIQRSLFVLSQSGTIKITKINFCIKIYGRPLMFPMFFISVLYLLILFFFMRTRNQLLFNQDLITKKKLSIKLKNTKFYTIHYKLKYIRINSEDDVQFCTTHHLDYR